MRDDHEPENSPPRAPVGSDEWERHKLRLGLLEGRRLAIDGFMWQAPALTLVVQAFLLRVLTDKTVNCTVATAVAVAGILATITAALALFLLHNREFGFGKRVEMEAKALGIDPIRRTMRKGPAHVLEIKGYAVWGVVLASFAVADGIALRYTQGVDALCAMIGVLFAVLLIPWLGSLVVNWRVRKADEAPATGAEQRRSCR
jgi:hypothetical protein